MASDACGRASLVLAALGMGRARARAERHDERPRHRRGTPDDRQGWQAARRQAEGPERLQISDCPRRRSRWSSRASRRASSRSSPTSLASGTSRASRPARMTSPSGGNGEDPDQEPDPDAGHLHREATGVVLKPGEKLRVPDMAALTEEARAAGKKAPASERLRRAASAHEAANKRAAELETLFKDANELRRPASHEDAIAKLTALADKLAEQKKPCARLLREDRRGAAQAQRRRTRPRPRS